MKHHWFYLKWYLRKTSSSPQQGFTMLEVLAALMISFAFLMGTLNALAITALMQVKAERQAQASYWIQQDLENVRSGASSYPYNSAQCGTMATNFNSSTSMPAVSPATKNLVNKSYVLERTPSFNGNILGLTYRVGEDNGSGAISSSTNAVVATLYTEILPSAALSCP